MSLATCVKNKPRVCEVHFVYDQDLNLYFRSKPHRRHSEEILINHYVSGFIVEQQGVKDKARGVYFEGVAGLMLDENEREKIAPLFFNRLGKGEKILDAARGQEGTQFYKISVDHFALFDERESIPGTKYELKRN